LQRLRAGNGRISLSNGDRDDVDSQVDHLLSRADQTLINAVQTASTDTPEVQTAHMAEVILAINQAGEMIEGAKAEAAAESQNGTALGQPA
jgi:hypothetical protein